MAETRNMGSIVVYILLLVSGGDDIPKLLKKLFIILHTAYSFTMYSYRLVTFNLGYLPGGDHTVVTNVDTTIQALQASSNVLQSGGLISVVAYVGHPGGRWVFSLPILK